jgi:hypothetical protein
MLGKYHKSHQTLAGHQLGIKVWTLKGITLNDTLPENQITDSHVWKPDGDNQLRFFLNKNSET